MGLSAGVSPNIFLVCGKKALPQSKMGVGGAPALSFFPKSGEGGEWG